MIEPKGEILSDEEWKKVPVKVEIWGQCWSCGKSYCKSKNGVEYGCPNSNCARNNT